MSSADLDPIVESSGPPPLPRGSGSAPVPPPLPDDPLAAPDAMAGPPPVAVDLATTEQETVATPASALPEFSAPDPAARPELGPASSVRPFKTAQQAGPAAVVDQGPMAAVDPAVVQVEAADDEDEEPHGLMDTLRASPPWLVSCLLHAAVVLVLGMIPLLIAADEALELVVGYTDQTGEQTELETFSDTDLVQLDEPVNIVPLDLEIVEDPLMASVPVPTVDDQLLAMPEVAAPSVGVLLTGRDQGMKDALLGAYGGTGETQAAVLNGLRWLHMRQDSDGMWSLSGRYRQDVKSRKATYIDGGELENKCAATAMAMLAFQGYGQTHLRGPHENFRKGMARAVNGLLKWQDQEGSFTKLARREDAHLKGHHRMYTQALCTFALCELYAMTEDSKLRQPAQRGVDYLVKYQDRVGGWKYNPGRGSDLSVTGWVMMALQSARMGGLKVPQSNLYKIEGFLDKVGSEGGSLYSYSVGQRRPSLAMTAEGLLCRQYLGWQQDHTNLVDGADLLVDNLIDFDGDEPDFYYWYYATQVLHNMEGARWHRWNGAMVKALPARQEEEGREPGSWSPKGDAWGDYGGRLYTTCLAIYMLEVYYRHLPIYSVNYDAGLGGDSEKNRSE